LYADVFQVEVAEYPGYHIFRDSARNLGIGDGRKLKFKQATAEEVNTQADGRMLRVCRE
jgi:hypothetical protein